MPVALVESVANFSEGRKASVVDAIAALPNSGDPDNAMVAAELDAERFWDLMIGAVESYG